MLPTFTFQPRKPYQRRPRAAEQVAAAPPQTLVLVSASYDENVPMVFLTFDRAVDASLFVARQVIVNDGSFDSGVYAASARRASSRRRRSAWRWNSSRPRRSRR
jgi:hypothetical protein